MGKLLRLEVARREQHAPAPRTTTSEARGRKARILLFTGVRREYLPGHPLCGAARSSMEERDVPETA